MNDEANAPGNVGVRPIDRADVPTLLRLLNEAAVFQNDDGAVTASAEELAEGLFREQPFAYGVFAESTTKVVGFATYCFHYSTYKGRPVLYLEDLFVEEDARGLGVGRAILRHLAAVAAECRCSSMEWVTPAAETNEALRFYYRIGAEVVDRVHGDTVCIMRLSAEGIERLLGR